VHDNSTAWTSAYDKDQRVVIPIKNGEGRYVGDAERLYAGGLVVASYVDSNPNGSVGDIAGIRNDAGNVVGLMPHPEHAIDALTGPSTDGLGFFTSVLSALVAA
jgi:phosphoribosylformylglycinamidine synthase